MEVVEAWERRSLGVRIEIRRSIPKLHYAHQGHMGGSKRTGIVEIVSR